MCVVYSGGAGGWGGLFLQLVQAALHQERGEQLEAGGLGLCCMSDYPGSEEWWTLIRSQTIVCCPRGC